MSIDITGNKITKQDAQTVKEIETLQKNSRYTFDNFIVIYKDVPNSMQVIIKFGFKNPNADDPTNISTIDGQELLVDKFTAGLIMQKTKKELYDAFLAKDATIVIQ